ncbi:Uncharacterised protein [Corynebacterium kutscheri]|uniref:DUF222 domain-containing protein n=1 Tax=Corynebacterium kutscheri TaxID=35755 RepID=A0AB38VPW8_9CORY|nr:hypothetical protein [Corynebacterium kutscheri]VEH05239.1 Uncharacterised protein [Corynebacterium kutscheri]VEH80706.1 Uncharacterised protein [Corynebacterium kutscheri]
MELFDALTPLFDEASAAINAVHRRPVNLRKVELTSSEATLRGARSNVSLPEAGVSEQESISAYSLLAPEAISEIIRTFARAPLQVFARIDVLAGGSGRPTGDTARLTQLADIIAARRSEKFISAIVHAEILSGRMFGSRSGTVARVGMRLAAINSGFDPRGLVVPEPQLKREEKAYVAASKSYFTLPEEFFALHARAFLSGVAEAESIARQASGSA